MNPEPDAVEEATEVLREFGVADPESLAYYRRVLAGFAAYGVSASALCGGARWLAMLAHKRGER